MLRVIHRDDADREPSLERLCRRETSTAPQVLERTRRILDDVRARGDAALRELTASIEGRTLGAIELAADEWRRLAAETPRDVADAIDRAYDRIKVFHMEEARRLARCGFVLDAEGAEVGLRLTPLGRVGIYAPGGTASYPSSVLMAAVPARAAGVPEVVMATPGPSPAVLYAARQAGVDRVYVVGGAQAIAALAYGTESVRRVDKVVGPGNAYVAAAKRLVFGDVAIDQIAGPSEVLIVADESARPDWLAADLLAQAEHDRDAHAVLVTPSPSLATAVVAQVERQLATLPRREIAAASLADHGAIVLVADLDEALMLVRRFAPEHLELQGARAEALADRAAHAGAIFVGAWTPEATGDYYAGPNHVLPTGGAARWGSPLGVHDFIRRTSLLRYGERGLRAHASDILRLAEAEGLEAHARAIRIRVETEEET